jgi:hypothetical protein
MEVERLSFAHNLLSLNQAGLIVRGYADKNDLQDQKYCDHAAEIGQDPEGGSIHEKRKTKAVEAQTFFDRRTLESDKHEIIAEGPLKNYLSSRAKVNRSSIFDRKAHPNRSQETLDDGLLQTGGIRMTFSLAASPLAF